MKIFLAGPFLDPFVETETDWRNSITSAFVQPMPLDNKHYEYPFQFLWKAYIAKGVKTIGKHDYVGPFSLKRTPLAYKPTDASLITRALLYSLTLADIVAAWVPVDWGIRYYEELSFQLGLAAAQDLAYNKQGERLAPKRIVVAIQRGQYPMDWFTEYGVDPPLLLEKPEELLEFLCGL